ncbi:MAG: hypothetical protein L0241_32205 [Planctomycetia bacterium]|nr:hypothetical protein [Planctomycetia bacterium]
MAESALRDSLYKLGAIFHMHDFILKMGRELFGEPNKRQTRRLFMIVDLDRLDQIVLMASTAKSWGELLRAS